jgi:hypothetical protein
MVAKVLKVAEKSTFCSWVYAIQSSNQHSFQKKNVIVTG